MTATLVEPWGHPAASVKRRNTRETPGAKGMVLLAVAKTEKVGVAPAPIVTATDAAGGARH